MDDTGCPLKIIRTQAALRGKVDDMGQMVTHTVKYDARFVGGATKLMVTDLTRDSHESVDSNWTGAELIVRSITLLRNGAAVKRYWGENFPQTSGFSADQWTDDEGRQHWRGHADNDGWLDLYVVNGWVSAGEGNYVVDIFELILREEADLSDARMWPPMGDKSLSGYQHNEFLRNLGGTLFQDLAPEHGVDSLRDGRGVAVADFDRDGRQDLFVANADALPHLFRNTAPRRSWIAFELAGAGPNPAAVGAKLRLTSADGGGKKQPAVTRASFVDGGNGFAGQSSPRRHFGLGDATSVERLEVHWPSGRIQTFTDLAAGRLYRLVEGEPEARPVTPRPPMP